MALFETENCYMLNGEDALVFYSTVNKDVTLLFFFSLIFGIMKVSQFTVLKF